MSVRRDHGNNITVSIAGRMRPADVHRVEHRLGAPVRELGRVLRTHMFGESVFVGCGVREAFEIAVTRGNRKTRCGGDEEKTKNALHRPNESKISCCERESTSLRDGRL